MAKVPPKGKELDAGDYFAAARDDADALSVIYSQGAYVLTLYIAGVAVECLFRAFRERKGLPFRSDHSLSDMAEEAGFPDIIPERQRERFGTAMADLIVRWRNSHRFRSNQAMRRFLKGLKLDRRLKGDFLKENARVISSSAIELVNLGVQRWEP